MEELCRMSHVSDHAISSCCWQAVDPLLELIANLVDGLLCLLDLMLEVHAY